MERIYDEYHNKINAGMTNLIEQYYNSPHNKFIQPQAIAQQYLHRLPNDMTHEYLQHSHSPALDKVISTYPAAVCVTTPTVNASINETQTNCVTLNIFCCILGITLLVVIVFTTYLAVTICRNMSTSEEDNQDEV